MMLGNVYRAEKRPDEARTEYEAAVRIYEPEAVANPRNLVMQVTHAVMLAHAGRHIDAARLAAQVREAAPRNPFLLYNIACAYALCAEAAAGASRRAS
jgi:tetratricopeptide (TPR) repeat protein